MKAINGTENKAGVLQLLELHCQGSTHKCLQIFEEILKRHEFEQAGGWLLKAQSFDRFAAAVALLKPAPDGYAPFYAEAAPTVVAELGSSAQPGQVEREVAKRWKLLPKEQRAKQCKAARDAVPYALSCSASEENRRLFGFALRLIAPLRPAVATDPTSPVPKVARLLGVRPKSDVWQRAIDDRAMLDKIAGELPQKTAAFEAARAAEDAAKATAEEAAKRPAPATRQAPVGDAKAALKVATKERSSAESILEMLEKAAQWLPSARARRKDATSPAHRALIEKYWHDHTSPDPSEKAQRRLRIGRGEYVYHQTHYQWEKTYAMMDDFKNEHPDVPVSRGIWQALKPYYVVRGTQNSCVCRTCENFRLLLKALHSNRKTFECLSSIRHRAATVIKRAWKREAPPPRNRSQVVEEDGVRKWWRSPGANVSVFDDLMRCDKKSDILRMVLCPLAVDSHHLIDGRDFHELVDTGEEHRKARVSGALNCTGCSRSACTKCDQGKRVWRSSDVESHFWGSLASPRQKITYHSYRTEEDENGNIKSDNDLHQHDVHPSKFLDELFVAVDAYKPHHQTITRQKRAHPNRSVIFDRTSFCSIKILLKTLRSF